MYADFSNFDNKHYLFSDKNRKALLHFKDENPDYSIKEFIGLRSKLYSYKTTSNIEEIKCMWYNKHFSKSYLNFQKYKNCHKQLKNFKFPFLGIRGYNHELFTVYQNKIVLSNFDSKMNIDSCNVHTFFMGLVK